MGLSVGKSIVLALGVLLAMPLAAHSQPETKVIRIGVLAGGGSGLQLGLEPFRARLRELGYFEGRNLKLEVRNADGRAERYPKLAAELVALKVDIIVVQGNAALVALRQATQTIPIVMAMIGDPVGAGFVASLAKPGGNITGLSNQAEGISAKWVQLLKEAAPGISRVGVLWDSKNVAHGKMWDAIRQAGKALGVSTVVQDVRGPDAIAHAFSGSRVRVIEIWSSLPFLYTIIIVSSIVVPIYLPARNLILQPSFWLLVWIMVIFSWMGITYYLRGEFYREKAKDYVGAAIAIGISDTSIMLRHILPNALTPVVSFAPFSVVANISALVALDFLGFGLPAPTPSWGELIDQGMDNLTKWWLVFYPLGAVFVTLLLIVFIGEAVREAFDPREYSRLR